MVGTDVHSFDRLVDWLERWHAGRDDLAPQVRLVVQHGRSRAPRLPDAAPFLAHDELQRAMTEADLVVCHGGPATITEARRHGHLPIVVPRDPAHDEHVDNHQQLFARRLGTAGMVRLVESEADLVAALDKGIADPLAYALAADPDRNDPRVAAATAVGRIVEDLVRASRAPGRRRWWR
ncbi:glycosyltransferase [Micromonospora sp. RTGN7]|uniref:glycosyltransferase n=1 Tax=Micromonospora sp. RTGN7 TaxID=3016526 RepID=UPI0029FF1315|nr:glycosyltransferase [Micromonospora sp. RTGN7]